MLKLFFFFPSFSLPDRFNPHIFLVQIPNEMKGKSNPYHYYSQLRLSIIFFFFPSKFPLKPQIFSSVPESQTRPQQHLNIRNQQNSPSNQLLPVNPFFVQEISLLRLDLTKPSLKKNGFLHSG